MPQTIENPQSEREKVESWRLHVLIEAGYPLPLAEKWPTRKPIFTARSSCDGGCTSRPPPRSSSSPGASIGLVKVEATEVEGRKVYSVRGFNNGVARWLNKLPTLWIEGEVTELRRQQRWASVFFTLKDPEDGATLAVQMPRGQFDALDLELGEGERVHVFGRAELYEQRGDCG